MADPLNGRLSRIRRAIGRGTAGGVLVSAALLTIVAGAIAAVTIAGRRSASLTTPSAIEYSVDTIVAAALLCGLISGFIIGTAAALSRPPAPGQAKQPSSDVARPFSERLEEFVGVLPGAEDVERAPKPSMSFFLAALPAGRQRPKSRQYIRSVLGRIGLFARGRA